MSLQKNFMGKREQFKKERERYNIIVSKYANVEMKKFFHLDAQAYENGKLTSKTKEMLGLVASLVLRCDDCILYHLDRCLSLGVTTEELAEVLNVGLIVGGSITIPHIRRAMDIWDAELSKPKPSE